VPIHRLQCARGTSSHKDSWDVGMKQLEVPLVSVGIYFYSELAMSADGTLAWHTVDRGQHDELAPGGHDELRVTG
jgi:hypothetical protein